MEKLIRVASLLLLLAFVACDNQVVTHDYDFVGKAGSHGPPWMLVEKNNKLGLIDKKWKVVVPVEYDQIKPFESVTYPDYRASRKSGFLSGRVRVTINGREVLSTRRKIEEVKKVTDFTYAIVRKGDKYGVINTYGTLFAPAIYDSIGRPGGFSANSPLLFRDGKIGALSMGGGILFEPEYDEIRKVGSFGANSAIVIKNGKQGVIGSSGNVLVMAEYDEIMKPGTFGANSAIVIKNGKQGVIGSSGNVLVMTEYDEIMKPGTFGAKSAIVIKNGKQGVIGSSGNVLVIAEYDEIMRPGTFGANSAIVIKNGKQGVIGSSGNVLIMTEYDEIGKVGSAGKSMALVKNGDKYGVVNSSGSIMVNVQYDSIGHYQSYKPKNTEVVADKKTDGPSKNVVTRTIRIPIIRISWSTTTTTTTTTTETMSQGSTLALVKKGNKYGYIDTNGEEVVPVNYRDASEIDIDSYLNRESGN
jgi:hypothetical protein